MPFPLDLDDFPSTPAPGSVVAKANIDEPGAPIRLRDNNRAWYGSVHIPRRKTLLSCTGLPSAQPTFPLANQKDRLECVTRRGVDMAGPQAGRPAFTGLGWLRVGNPAGAGPTASIRSCGGTRMPFDGTDLKLAENHPLAKLGEPERLLASEERWCKGKLRDSNGRHCLVGACKQSTRDRCSSQLFCEPPERWGKSTISEPNYLMTTRVRHTRRCSAYYGVHERILSPASSTPISPHRGPRDLPKACAPSARGISQPDPLRCAFNRSHNPPLN